MNLRVGQTDDRCQCTMNHKTISSFITNPQLCPKMKMSGTSGKYQMKGGVGISWHEKEREQKDAYAKTENHS